MSTPRSSERADLASADGSPARRVWGADHWAKWLSQVDAGKRSANQIAKNAVELGAILAAAGFEGPDDIADLSEAEVKTLAGTTVTPMTSLAVRARAFARRAADTLKDVAPVRGATVVAAPAAQRKTRVEHDREARL